MRAVDLAGADVDAPWLADGGTFLVNGVDVVPLVAVELDRTPSSVMRLDSPMTKVDLKKELDSYRARRAKFRVVDVSPAQYLMVHGQGDPNAAQDYADPLRRSTRSPTG